MGDSEQGSELARILRQIDLETEAACRGLWGLATVASHEIITAKYNALGVCAEKLEPYVGKEQAMRIVLERYSELID